MNLDRIEALLQLIQQAEVSELQVEGTDWRVRARKERGLSRREEPSAPVPSEEAPALPRRARIVAPRVGRFHLPEAAAPRAGERVEAGQTLGNIESMGILTPVTAPEAAELVNTLVVDGQGVEFGQELFEIAPFAIEADPGTEA
jgi:biotin carboxyl carrier protein